MKLHLGCSNKLKEGWVNTDAELSKTHRARPQVTKLDVTEPFPYINNSIDIIYHEHLLEHINYQDQQRMLSECHRTLINKGIMRLATPNIHFIMNLTKENDKNKLYIDTIFKHFLYEQKQNVPNDYQTRAIVVINNAFRDWGHLFLLSRDSIKTLLVNAGFALENIKECKYGESDHKELVNAEMHGNNEKTAKIARMETIIFEVTK